MKNLKLFLFISILAVIFSLTGCGVKGDLVHPQEQNQEQQENQQSTSQSDSNSTSSTTEKETR